MGAGQECVDRKTAVPRVIAMDNFTSAKVVILRTMGSLSSEMRKLSFRTCRYGTVFAYASASGTGNRHPACKR